MTTTAQRLLALQYRVIDSLGKQPYIRCSFFVVPDDRGAYSISWNPHDIDNDVRFWGDSEDEVFEAAHEYLDNLPDPETQKIQAWQTRLAKLIDDAPVTVDTKPLSIFKEELFKCLSA